MPYPLQHSLDPQPYWYKRLVISSVLGMTVVLSGWFAAYYTHAASTTHVLDNTPNAHSNYLRYTEQAIAHAEHRIWVMMYVIRHSDQPKNSINQLCTRLVRAHQRGVDVRVVLDHSPANTRYPGPNNHPVGTWLRTRGIQVVFDELRRTTHAKILLIDQRVIIGSHNWTNYAVNKNREISLTTQEPSVIRDIERTFTDIPTFNTSTSTSASAP